MKTMYGLFRMTYDYYEWETISAVSDDMQKLVEKYEAIKKFDDPDPLATQEQHEHYARKERWHYVIKPVEVV